MSDVATEPSTSRSPWRHVVRLILLAAVAMWVYILYLAIGPGRQDPADLLDDPSFARAAQARCDEALDVVATLPPASEAPSAGQRADVIDEANASFEAMVDDLEAMAPSGEDGRLVSAWLDDWRTYLDDRDSYADRLRDDPDAQLLVTPRAGEQVTEFIDAFAADNDMPACSTPIDV